MNQTVALRIPPSPQPGNSPSHRATEPPSLPGAKRIRSAEGLSRDEKRAAMRLHARLSRYYLPSVEIQNLSLDAALMEIEKLIEKSDYRGWLKDEPLSLTIADSDSVARGWSCSLNRSNLSATEALQLLAIQAGKSLVFYPSGVELVDFSEDPVAPFLTRTFKVEPGKFYRRSPYIQHQLAKIEIIREFVYTTEFEPPEICCNVVAMWLQCGFNVVAMVASAVKPPVVAAPPAALASIREARVAGTLVAPMLVR